jgi:phosphatidylglycerophosphate synthase
VTTIPRRVVATRETSWAKSLARTLAERDVQPNHVSVASIGFAVVACAALVASPDLSPPPRALALVAAAAGIQLRLLCNLLDGMLAVEQRLKTPTGEIFNELPDRIADVVILVGAGYAAPGFGGAALGWAAAVAALLTAYVRALAGSLGFTQSFVGPMAKPHRMFTLTVAALLAASEAISGQPARAIPIGLTLILVGSMVTVTRRTRRLLREAEAR